MEIRVTWRSEKMFNFELATQDGGDAFLAVKGCKIIDGAKGKFVSGPSWKNDKGEWVNYTYMGPKFQEALIAKALAAKAPPKAAPKGAQGSGFDDMDSEDIPW